MPQLPNSEDYESPSHHRPSTLDDILQCRWPLLIGIRHHSPAMAVAAPKLLADFSPDVLAIELPAEAAPWLEWLTDPRAAAPMAMAFSGDDGLSLYPFADFSPELAALRWARQHDIPVRCIDLPIAQPAPEESETADCGDARGRLALESLARAQPQDTQETWDRLIEANAPHSSPEQLRVAALAHGWALRLSQGVDARTAAREQWMAQCLATDLTAGRRVAALVGSFHAPALAGIAQAVDSLTSDASDDEGLPAGAATVTSALVRYTFAQLDSRSGYPAGIRDPGWQQLVYQSGLSAASIRSAATQTITEVTRVLRTLGHPAGPGEAAEAGRMALDLATLRGLAAPSRRELIEAVTAVLAQGEILGRGRLVAESLEKVLIGNRSGQLAPGTPVSPLRETIRCELEAAGLPTTRSEAITLVPQRNPHDLTRHVLLNRLAAGGITYGIREDPTWWRGAATIGISWQVHWTTSTQASIELASAKGLTAEQIATTALLTRDVTTANDAQALLVEAAECASPAATKRALDVIAAMAATVDFPHAVKAMAALADIATAHIPGASLLAPELIDRAGQLCDEFTAAAVRELRGIEGSDNPADAQALASFVHHGREHALSLNNALQHLLTHGSPLMQGAAAGLLLDETAMQRRISSWLDAATPQLRTALRRRLVGLLATAASRFDSAPATQALIERVGLISDDQFVGILPALRGGFDYLSPEARAALRDELAQSLGGIHDLVLTPEETLAATSYDHSARARLAALGLADLAFSPAERWRLVLGTQRDQLSTQGRRMASALDELYGRPGADSLDERRRGSAWGPSQLGVRRWREEIEALFGSGEVTEIFGEAAAQGRADVLELLNPETVRPSVDLLATALSLTGALSESQLKKLRPLVARLVKELSDALAIRLRPVLRGLASTRPTRRRTGRINLPRTIRANLHHVVPVADRAQVIPAQPVFHSAMRAQVDWHLIIVVDVSGSMSESVVYSALTAAILAQTPALNVEFLTFDTSVIDFTGHVTDPLTLLLEIEVGGGTDIARALSVARSRVKVPKRTLVVLISDFEEYGSIDPLLAEVTALASSGTHLLGCAALNDSGTGVYNVGIAAQVAAAGMRVAAVSPLDLARWVGTVLREAQ